VLERLTPLPRVQRVMLVGQNGGLVCCAFSSDEGEVDFAGGEGGKDVSAQGRPEVVCRAVLAEGGLAEEHVIVGLFLAGLINYWFISFTCKRIPSRFLIVLLKSIKFSYHSPSYLLSANDSVSAVATLASAIG
jgi:hypothetical protein